MPEFSCRKNLITGDNFPADFIGSSSTRRPHWLVRLLELRDDVECVGSLISETHVLTSAYCCAEKCKGWIQTFSRRFLKYRKFFKLIDKKFLNPVKDDSTCGGEKFAAVLGDWNAATWTGMEQFGVTKGKLRKVSFYDFL